MNKIFKRLNIVLFLVVIFSLFIINLLFYNKEDISYKENRELAKFPTLSYDNYKDGSYFKEIENYYSDRFIFRDNFMSVSSAILSFKGYSSDGIEIINTGANLVDNVEGDNSNDNQNNNNNTSSSEDTNKNTATNTEDGNESPSTTENTDNNNQNSGEENSDDNGSDGEDQVVNAGQFVVVNNVGYETFTYNEYFMTFYFNAINYYADNLPENVKIYSILAPTSAEFNLPKKYSSLSDSQKDGIEYVKGYFRDRINSVDVYSALEAHKDEYLYFKTDHHWTPLGAYWAYDAFMRYKGETPIPLSNYKKVDSKNKFLGSIYGVTSSAKLANNKDDIWYYDIPDKVLYEVHDKEGNISTVSYILYPYYFDYDSKYAVFMGGDMPFAKITTEHTDKPKILIVKDSYANALIPFLAPHYSEIYIADPRNCPYNIIKIIEDNSIDELAFIDYAQVLKLNGFSDMIKALGTK